MTFDDVFKQPAAIDKAAVSILKAAGFPPDEGQAGSVCPLRDHAEDVFLRRQTENMLDSLQLFHEDFSYLKSPVSGEYRLELFPDGRYGYLDRKGNTAFSAAAPLRQGSMTGMAGSPG